MYLILPPRRWLLLVTLSLLVAASAAAARLGRAASPVPGVGVRHVHLAPDDAFLLCAREVFHKPVSADAMGPRPADADAKVPPFVDLVPIRCPQAKDRLIADIQAAGFVLFESPDWVYVTERHNLRPLPFRQPVKWSRIAVKITIEQPSDTNDTADVPTALRQSIRDVFRTVPLSFGSDDQTAETEVLVHWNMPNLEEGRRSVVAVEAGAGQGRLLYGELQQGRYTPLWDSPLLDIEVGFRWEYRDLDGDGVKEILVWSSANPYYHTLMAFDITGRELIHEEPSCSALAKISGTCPILGEGIDFEDTATGKVDILAEARSDEAPRRYRLVDHQYQLVK